MPIIKSAKKRVKVAKKAAVRNSKTKRTLKSAIKSLYKDIATGKKTDKSHSAAQCAVSKAAKKNVIHKNKAARIQKQLASKAKAASKTTKVASPAKKAPAKKAAPKKTTAKPKAKTAKK